MEEETHHSAPHHTPHKKSFFKQKGVLYTIIGVVVVLLLAYGAYFFVSSRTAALQEEEAIESSDVVQTLSPEEIGLTMTAKPDKKAVKFKIEKAGDIKSIDYTLAYEADSTAQDIADGAEKRVSRGVTGSADIKGASYESEWLDLGSCSRNVCKYDAGVEKVDLTVKIIKKDGKVYESQQSLEL